MRRSEGRAVASARSGLAVSRANPLRQRRRISGRGFWKIDRLNLQGRKGSAVLRAAEHLPVPGARAHLPSRSKAFDSRRAHFLREPTSTTSRRSSICSSPKPTEADAHSPAFRLSVQKQSQSGGLPAACGRQRSSQRSGSKSVC